MKRKITSQAKTKALSYIKDKIDFGDSLVIIYVSFDDRIIIYEDLAFETITICSTNFKHFKELQASDFEDTILLFHLLDFLQEYYINDYVKEITRDFINTDLEKYEDYKF